jgi:hypothetical protein
MPALPNPFDSGVLSAFSPDEAAASTRSHAPNAAADIQQSAPSTEPTTAAVTSNQPVAADFLDDISNIGEIFVGAAKLEPVEMWFENAAYPREDELLYDVLRAMDDPCAADLIDIPDGMWGEFDPAPLFLRQAV